VLALDLSLEALLDVREGVVVGDEDLSEQGDVGDGQAQRVDLGEPLLEGESGHMAAQLVEGAVDAEHALAFPDVGRVPLHLVRAAREAAVLAPAIPARLAVRRCTNHNTFMYSQLRFNS